jgi:hypothetical protein
VTVPFPDANALAAAVVAPFVGSFLGVVVARLPEKRDVVGGRSRCPACGHVLGVRDLAPLLSWAVLRGRCRHCGARIGWIYPAVELGALGVAVWAASVVEGWLLWVSCGLGWTLLALAAIDLRHYLLPNALTLPLAAACRDGRQKHRALPRMCWATTLTASVTTHRPRRRGIGGLSGRRPTFWE